MAKVVAQGAKEGGTGRCTAKALQPGIAKLAPRTAICKSLETTPATAVH